MKTYKMEDRTAMQIAAFRAVSTQTKEQTQRSERVRDAAYGFARNVAELTPPGRKRALALTSIEEALLWAISAIVDDAASQRSDDYHAPA